MAPRQATEPRRRPAGARAVANRQAIMAAACRVFLAEGFEARMDDIAVAADVSKVTLYNHYESKEVLFIAVIEAELESALEKPMSLVESRLADSTNVRDDIIAACRAWVAGLASPDMIALRNLVAGASRRFPELAATWRTRGPARFHPVIAEALRQLCRRGRISIPDVDVAVLQLSGLVVSPNLVYGAYGSPLTARFTDQLIVAGVDMFLDYYRVRRK